MKRRQLSFGILIGVAMLTVTSCNKKGCTDETATNYNEKAKKDDGSCEFSGTELTVKEQAQMKISDAMGNTAITASLSGIVGTTSGGMDISTIDSWFTTTNYKGAVESGSTWTDNWTVDLNYTRGAVPGSFDQVLSSDITTNTTISANSNIQLDGPIHVKNNATLTIEEGVTFYAKPSVDNGGTVDPATVAYLLIERGSKIDAQGTSSSPIVFTSGEASPEKGDWGGLILCGSAPINRTGSESTAEVGGILYGGNSEYDNSGTLKYVRVEYTGNAINSEKEHNGFTFNGVGSGTTVEYIQAYRGNDDGLEFFGGTVNVKYALSTASKDDSYDWTYGWSGKGQFWVAQQVAEVGDRGFEGDGSSKDNLAVPYSNPTISNVTLIGNDPLGERVGMKLREGTKGMIYNAIITGFQKHAIEVEHDATIQNVIDEELGVYHTDIDGTINVK